MFKLFGKFRDVRLSILRMVCNPAPWHIYCGIDEANALCFCLTTD